MIRKTWTIGELFTGAEIDKAVQLYKQQSSQSKFIDEVVQAIVKPALPRINRLTGQENDARYLAYALEYAIISSSR